MKILLINYHYFIHGGPDRYFFNIKDSLELKGHTVIPFSFDYNETLDTPFRKYFPAPITGHGPCLLDQQKLDTRGKLQAMLRLFHNSELERQFRLVVEETKPDIVYSIYLSSSFVPKILMIAKQDYGLPVVYRLSDYHMFCSSYLFCRNGLACTECIKKPLSAIRYRCVHDSGVASFLRVVQQKYYLLRGWYSAVDYFICPSKFMGDFLIDMGISHERIKHIPSFAPNLDIESRVNDSNPYMLYFGKICPEKGVEKLIRAFNRIDQPSVKLRIVGQCSSSYREKLAALLDKRHASEVLFETKLSGDELWECVRNARFVVLPALWYENMPNVILEAFSAGKAVVTSDIGSLPELVNHGINGLLSPPGDIDALYAAINLLSEESTARDMGQRARETYLSKFTEERHTSKLIHILEALVMQTRRCNAV